MRNKLLYTTKEIFNSYLDGKKYIIPEYQRGYKWDSNDINRLLDDINNFSINEDLNLFYCLQNITLIENEKENSFNVVDGQQRLTTLAIILSFLKEYDLIKDKLQYNVREQTKSFLDKHIYKPSNSIVTIASWDNFLSESKQDYDYQDIYYIFNAYKTVQKWFESNASKKLEMKDKILNHTKIIVNLPKNIGEQKLFENLNGKRVPLDGADLIRAIIITRIAKTEIGEMLDYTKQNVLLNEKRVKIGLLLDSINFWWSEDNKRIYFHHFVKDVKVSNPTSIAFNDKTFPINNLYKLYSLLYNDGVLSMDFFEKKSIDYHFLQELQLLQRTIEDWYNDRELYHLILYTMIYANIEKDGDTTRRLTFKELYNKWRNSSRKEFLLKLKKIIAETDTIDDLLQQVNKSEADKENIAFQEMWYDNKLVNVSILLDIISILSLNANTKLPAKYFKVHKEDFEHIFPQTPIGDRIKDKNKQTQILYQYLEIINNELMNEEQKVIINEEEINWDDQEWKDRIKAIINDSIAKIIPINSLGNMCVLHESVNRGYGNDFFLEKRIDIMHKSQAGCFIRPHVYAAFNKIYSQRQNEYIDIDLMTNWGKSDILERREYIITQINNFLKKSHEQA